jgi:hypothetical protein
VYDRYLLAGKISREWAPGTAFDIHFRVIETGTINVVLQSGWYPKAHTSAGVRLTVTRDG